MVGMVGTVRSLRGLETARRWSMRLVLVGGAMVALSACHQTGPTFVVDTTVDSVDVDPGDGTCADSLARCSLRAAVMESNALPGVDGIVLAGGVHELTLAGADEDAALTGDLDITDAVSISGTGTVDANGLDRVFDQHTTLPYPSKPNLAPLVQVEGLTITGGSADHGAAYRGNAASQVILSDVRVTGNVASVGAPIETGHNVIAIQSLFDGNTGGSAGAMAADDSDITLIDATVSGNTASAGAGAIRSTAGGVARVITTTVTDNTGTTAGGLHADGGTVDVKVSIVADQAVGADCAGAVTTSGGNVEAGTTCGFTGTNDAQNAAALLKPLADNGGTHPTHLLSVGSAALDRATPTDCTSINITVDQRDQPRPVGSGCDSGAVEMAVGELTGLDCGPPHNLVPGAQLQRCDLSGQNLAGIDLTGANLTEADLTGANATLTGLAGADLTGADLTGAALNGTDLRTTTITATTAMADVVAFGVDLSGVDLSGVDLSGAHLNGADLSGATLTGTTLTDATLRGASLAYAVDLPAAVGVDSTLAGSWRGTSFAAAGLDVTGVALGTTDFTNANFFGADGFGSTSTAGVTWSNTVCPDGSNSNANGGTCVGHLASPPAPVVALDVPTPDGANGWFVSDPVEVSVTVTAGSVLAPLAADPECTDDGAPLALTGTSPGPWTLDVTGNAIHDLECTATDILGQIGTDSATVQLDAAGFEYTLIESPAPNDNGWHASGPVTLAVELGTPSISGLDIDASDCTEAIDGGPATSIDFSRFTIDTETGTASLDIDGNGIHVIECDVVTNAGVHTTGGATVRIDDQVPTGTTSVLPAPNANGWHNADVTLRAVMTADNVSGIDFASSGCTRNGVPVPLTEYDFTPPDTLDIVVHDDGIFDYECTVTNLAGVSQSSSATVKIDRAGFDYTLTESPAPNANGWHASGPVTLSVELGTPSLSGLDIDASDCTEAIDGGPATSIDFSRFTIDTENGTASLDIDGNGVHVIECDVVTNAGVTTTGSATVSIDDQVTAGTTEIVPAANADGWHNTDVTLRATLAIDNVSGIDFASSGCTRNGVPVPLTEYDYYPPDVLEIVVHDDGIWDYECTVVTNAGLSASSSATVKLDSEAIDGDVTVPAPDLVDPDGSHPGAWYVGPVTVSATMTSTNLSGISTDPTRTFCTLNGSPVPVSAFTQTGPSTAELTISGDGTHELYCQITSVAGVVSSDSLTINIDSALA